MQIELNKEQLEFLKYAVLWYESNDEKEEEICQQLESRSNAIRTFKSG